VAPVVAALLLAEQLRPAADQVQVEEEQVPVVERQVQVVAEQEQAAGRMWVLPAEPAVLPEVEEAILLPVAIHVGVKRLSKLVFYQPLCHRTGRFLFCLVKMSIINSPRLSRECEMGNGRGTFI
jgi:hypothetical protein